MDVASIHAGSPDACSLLPGSSLPPTATLHGTAITLHLTVPELIASQCRPVPLSHGTSASTPCQHSSHPQSHPIQW